MLKQLHVYFSGKVQGVGFRFTAHSMAQDLGVTGWVRNGESGNVEITAEAEEDVLLYFLKQIHENFAGSIRETKAEWGPATGAFKDFAITR